MKRPYALIPAIVAPLLAGACTKEPAAGIVLGLETDVVVPAGINAVSLVVSDEESGALVGAPLTRSVDLGTNSVRFPATLTLETAFEESTFSLRKPTERKVKQVRISLVGLQGASAKLVDGKAVILRRVVTTMPTEGLHFLRLSLDALDMDTVAPIGAGAPTGAVFEANYRSVASNCPSGAAFDRVVGNCVRIPELNGDTLPLFSQVSDAMSGACFSTASAFAGGTRVQIANTAECTVPLPAGLTPDPTRIAVALEADGVLFPADAPDADAQASSGVPAKYTFAGDRLRFDPGVCALLAARTSVQAAWISGAGAKRAGQPICGAAPARVDGGVADGSAGDGGSSDPMDALFGPIESIGGNENALDFDVAPNGTMTTLGTNGMGVRLVDLTNGATVVNPTVLSADIRGRFVRSPLSMTGYLWTGGASENLRLRTVIGAVVGATPLLQTPAPARVLAFALDPIVGTRVTSYVDGAGPHLSVDETTFTNDDVRAISFGYVNGKRVTYIGRGDTTVGVGIDATNFSTVGAPGPGVARAITPTIAGHVVLALEDANRLVLVPTDENLANPGSLVVASPTLEPARMAGEPAPGAVFLATVPNNPSGLYLVATAEGIRAFTFDPMLQPVPYGWLMKPKGAANGYVNIGLKVVEKCIYFTAASEVLPAPVVGGPGQFRRCLK